MYDHLKLRIVVQCEWPRLYSVRHGAQPCYYSNPEWTNQIVALKRVFYVFARFVATVVSPTRLEGEGEHLTNRCHEIPHAGPLGTELLH